MATKPPAAFMIREPKNTHPDAGAGAEPDLNHTHLEHHRRPAPKLPVIPDLRFEYSYVRSVQPYVTVERVPAEPESVQALLEEEVEEHEGYEKVDREGEKGIETEILKEEELKKRASPSEMITVQWNKIAWVTLRDQVISPLLQGALWALASYYVRPFSAELGSRMGTFVHGTLPKKEGSAVSWLRGWAKSIGLSSSMNNNNNVQRTSK